MGTQGHDEGAVGQIGAGTRQAEVTRLSLAHLLRGVAALVVVLAGRGQNLRGCDPAATGATVRD